MKYGQKVKVTSGFYEGMEGTVIRESIIMESPYLTAQSFQTMEVKYPTKKVSYKCILNKGIELIESDFIPESSLELTK